MMRIKEKFETVLKYWYFKKLLKKNLKGHNILWTILLWKPLLNPEVIKKQLKFSQDHQYKTNVEKWVFTDETQFWFQMPKKEDRLRKERTIFNPRQKKGIKGLTVMKYSVNIKVQFKFIIRVHRLTKYIFNV